jgi:hypothetical protein
MKKNVLSEKGSGIVWIFFYLVLFSSFFLGNLFSLNLSKIFFTFWFYLSLAIFGWNFISKRYIVLNFSKFSFHFLVIFLICCFKLVFSSFYFDSVILTNQSFFIMFILMIFILPTILLDFKKSKFIKIGLFFSILLAVSSLINLGLTFFSYDMFALINLVSPMYSILFLILILFLFSKKILKNNSLLFFLILLVSLQIISFFKFDFYRNILETWRINQMYVSSYFNSIHWNFNSIFAILFGSDYSFKNYILNNSLSNYSNQVFLSLLLVNGGLIIAIVTLNLIFKFLSFGLAKNNNLRNVYLAIFGGFIFQLALPVNLILMLGELILIIFLLIFDKNNQIVFKFNLTDFVKLAKTKTLKKMVFLHKSCGFLIILFSLIGLIRLIFLILSFVYLNQSLFYLALGQDEKYYLLSEKSVEFDIIKDDLFRQNSEANLRKSYLLLDKINNSSEEKVKLELEKKHNETIKKSIDQAIRATVIDYSYQNLFFLAQVYKNCYGLVERADDWSNVAFAKALVLNNNDVNLYLQWANLFVIKKDYQSALKIYEKGLATEQNKSLVYYNLANLMIKMNNNEKATDYYNLAMSNLSKKNSWYESNRAKIIKEINLIKSNSKSVDFGVEK